MPDENLRLRAALRDLVALSTIPAGWIGIDRTIATASSQVNDRFWHFAEIHSVFADIEVNRALHAAST
jgi:hypothetical protein